MGGNGRLGRRRRRHRAKLAWERDDVAGLGHAHRLWLMGTATVEECRACLIGRWDRRLKSSSHRGPDFPHHPLPPTLGSWLDRRR